MNEIKFTNDISLEHLNPFNYALKNDYMCNLFSTGLAILPALARTITYPIYVKKAMTSRRVLLSGNKPRNSIDLKLQEKFSEGLALCVSWDMFNASETIEAVQGVMSSLDENLIAVIDNTDNHVSFYRNTKDKVIYETTEDGNGNVRTIRRY